MKIAVIASLKSDDNEELAVIPKVQ